MSLQLIQILSIYFTLSHALSEICPLALILFTKEASSLFGIGQHRLRAIISEDYGCKYHLMMGRTIKIKRKAFEVFLNEAEQI